MTQEEIISAINVAALFVVAYLIVHFKSYFKSYLKKKAENLATKEDYESILAQLKKTTAETEGIKVELAKGNWLHQQSWNLKEKYYSSLLEALYNLEMSLSVRLDCYMYPGSEQRDEEIGKSEYYINQSKIGYEALKKIQQLHGPAEIVISERAVEALKALYISNWEADNFSSCNKEYLDKVYESVEEARKIILEEARSELISTFV
ncbi:hypothetical protein [Methylobacter sp. sgz302048]|uniref:hypothetical protein n=1 Tax=Methylobacter sp. sgz302048 TaxID=3455945 RepID=UPI003FA152ED